MVFLVALAKFLQRMVEPIGNRTGEKERPLLFFGADADLRVDEVVVGELEVPGVLVPSTKFVRKVDCQSCGLVL